MKIKRAFTFKVVGFILAIAMMLPLISVCSAANNIEAAQQAAFDALPDDAIVCYLLGRPVYKYQIDENRRIHLDVVAPASLNADEDYVSLAENATLPLAHRGEVITATVTTIASGYSQTECISYLPNGDAEETANGFEDAGSVIGWGGLLVSVLGLTGSTAVTFLGIITSIAGITSGTISGEIRDLTDAGNDVILAYVYTNYGAYYAVAPWDGITCVKEPASIFLGSMTVEVTCKHDVSPWS